MKFVRIFGLAVLSVLAVSGANTSAWAQPGPGGPGGPGGSGGRGGMGGMRRSPKMRLTRLIGGAVRLDGPNALTKAQARKMVSLVSPWKSRPTMSEDAGKALYTNLTNTLTATQKTALQNGRGGGRMGGPGGPGGQGGGRMGGGFGGGRGGGGGRMGGGFGGGRNGGPGGPGGQRPSQAQMDQMRSQMEKMMASYNPLYMGSSGQNSMPPQMQQFMKMRRDRLASELSQLQQKAR